ncbi:MAG: SDR family oxidoreductase [bacterium]|nr:SDR family oxidoreductase [bacterium]MDT8364990.1 SDR family oxidoreductase [bacterium]
MKILFIGGTGIISSSCSREAVRQGHELFHLNRGSHPDLAPPGVTTLKADIRNSQQVGKALAGHRFDCIVNWVAFEPEHVRQDIKLLGPLTQHYIFISSASVYLKPPPHWFITEETPVGNPYWPYAQGKIACEELLLDNHRKNGFPVTIVRPSHTYTDGWVPTPIGSRDFTIARRLLDGKKVISPGNGQSLWTITHSDDFARGFTGLLVTPEAVGEIFHITSDEARTWDAFYRIIGKTLGLDVNIVHIPSDVVNEISSTLGQGLMGDKGYSMVFDNSKIKRFVPGFSALIPFQEGIHRSLNWFEEDPVRKVVDPARDAEIDRVLKVWAQQNAERRTQNAE